MIDRKYSVCMEYPRKHVEQFEVIERSVIESRRPLTNNEAQNYVPTSYTQTSTDRYFLNDPVDTRNNNIFHNNHNDDAIDKYYFTGEREKDSSVLYNSNYSPSSEIVNNNQTRVRNYSSGINNYGYDLHEIQTSDGGARIVQTHGSGNILSRNNLNDSSFNVNDRSLDNTVLKSNTNSSSRLPTESPRTIQDYHEKINKEIDNRQTVTTSPNFVNNSEIIFPTILNTSTKSDNSLKQPQSILKNSESWKRFPSVEDNSLSRKDSYKRMQEGQADTSFYGSSSNAGTLNSKTSQKQWILSNAKHKVKKAAEENLCFERIKDTFAQNFQQIREANWTPRLIGTLILAILLIILLIFILWLILSSFFFNYSFKFLLYPPLCEECLKRNPSAVTYNSPSQLFVHLSSPAQAHFELVGNLPFKSNSFTAIDFYTGYIAIADHALTDENGRHTTCFLMELDRTALPDMSVLIDGLDNTYHEVRTQFGWQEYWQFNPESIDERFAREKFKDEIDDCKYAKWYFLKHTVYTKDSSCSTCYDFCLPDYAVLRRQKYEDEATIGIRRLNCFRIYVPEWSRFNIESDDSGGHWKYPKQFYEKQNIQRRQTKTPNNSDSNRLHYNLVGNWVGTDQK